MLGVVKQPDTIEKLTILSRDSQYDLACACATAKNEHRRRSPEGKWVYPVTLPQGGTTYLLKTLLTNECINDCKYCPLRASQDPRRCRLSPEETVKAFFAYYRRRRVNGLFLSSGVRHSPDAAMEDINRTGRLLRRSGFRGYIHLKIIPGASDAAIREALSLSTTVSLNIETAVEKNFQALSRAKDYQRDILRPLKLISRLTQKGAPYSHVKKTTQFVVGASDETDREITACSEVLYRQLRINRVYFSAYQQGRGEHSLSDEDSRRADSNLLTREHRLYQADWLIRKYGFKAAEIPFEPSGNFSLEIDPKEAWARSNPDRFPVNLNRADKFELLRVPGLGEVAVGRILALRARGRRIRRIEDLGRVNKLLKKASPYVSF